MPARRHTLPRQETFTPRARLRLGTGLVAAAVAACAPRSPSGSAREPARTLSGTVQIWANRVFPFHEDVGGEIAKRFTTQQPQVRIESEPLVGNAVEKLTAAVAAGTPPELVSVGPHEVQSLAVGGVVQSLEDYVKRSGAVRKEDIWPSLLNDVSYRGQLYGMPYGPDLRVLYLGADRYQAAGLDVTRPPRTWNELEQAIAKVHRGGRGSPIEHLGFDPFLGSGGIYRWLVPYWQLGGELLSADQEKVTLNNEKAIQALTWLKQIVDSQGGYEAIQAFEQGSTYQQLFMDNKVTHLYATYAERAQEFQVKAPAMQYGFAGYPLPPNGRRANYGGGHTFPISHGAKNPDGAWAFLEHLSSDESNLAFADRYDRIPIRISTTRSERFHKNDPFRKLAVEEMPGRRFVISAPGGAEALALQGNFVTEIMLGKIGLREGLADAQSQLQQVLDKWRR
ncbi:MAG TPA: extracellular solute-binding protein [Chloroflexota bacterium]|nr:extracellular solute-binding protein [Chloroflexota bacterium]